MKESSSFVFTGDIGFDKYMDQMWEDDDLLSADILDFLHSADHVVANVEGALVKDRSTLVHCAEERLLHTINPSATRVLKDMRADIWNLANNHIMDAGPEGLMQTLSEAGRFGADTLGAGMDIKEAATPLILDEAGGIGLFAVGYQRGCKPAGEEKAGCLSWSDMDTIQSTIHDIKKKCRWCIVVSHGGEEFTSLPSPYTRDRYLQYLDMGADLVVSHHPHVPMNYELLKDKAIFYSLGNFIFDTDYQRAQFHTDVGVLLKISFTPNSFSFMPFGIKIDRNNEHIVKGEIPDIFIDVQEEEYRKLAPLAAKMFVSATKRQQIFLYPAEYQDASEEKWEEHFANPKRSGRVPGEALDFAIICPLAKEEEKKAWVDSKLEHVKKYILEQM